MKKIALFLILISISLLSYSQQPTFTFKTTNEKVNEIIGVRIWPILPIKKILNDSTVLYTYKHVPIKRKKEIYNIVKKYK